MPSDSFKTDVANRLLHYWREKCGNRPRPLLSDLELMDLYDIAPLMFIRDVVDGGKDLRCRFWGTEMASAYHMDCSGKLVSDSFTAYGSKNTLDIYMAALESGLPMRLLGNLGYVGKSESNSFEGIMLSLDGKDHPKQHVIGAFAFRYQMDNEDKVIYQTRVAPVAY